MIIRGYEFFRLASLSEKLERKKTQEQTTVRRKKPQRLPGRFKLHTKKSKTTCDFGEKKREKKRGISLPFFSNPLG